MSSVSSNWFNNLSALSGFPFTFLSMM